MARFLALAPAAARACPVCFGNDAGPLSQGARAAAFVLLGLTALVLGGVLAFVLRLHRRQRGAMAAGMGASASSGTAAAGASAAGVAAEAPVASSGGHS